MGYYKKQEYDFIERTKKILSDYEKFFSCKCMEGEKKYEITLLLNCCFGLLVLPQQHRFKDIPNEELSKDKRGIDPENISLSIKDRKESHAKGVNTVVRHIRNSISHYRFETFNDDNNEICGVKFEDYKEKNKKTPTFKAEFYIKEIKNFLNIFSDYMLKKMKS